MSREQRNMDRDNRDARFDRDYPVEELPTPCHWGVIRYEDTVTESWWVFKQPIELDQALAAIEAWSHDQYLLNGIITPAFSPEATPPLAYSPTGRWFYGKPWAQRSRTRLLIRQTYALDC